MEAGGFAQSGLWECRYRDSFVTKISTMVFDRSHRGRLESCHYAGRSIGAHARLLGWQCNKPPVRTLTLGSMTILSRQLSYAQTSTEIRPIRLLAIHLYQETFASGQREMPQYWRRLEPPERRTDRYTIDDTLSKLDVPSSVCSVSRHRYQGS